MFRKHNVKDGQDEQVEPNIPDNIPKKDGFRVGQHAYIDYGMGWGGHLVRIVGTKQGFCGKIFICQHIGKTKKDMIEETLERFIRKP